MKLRDLVVGKSWSACAGVINPVKPSDFYLQATTRFNINKPQIRPTQFNILTINTGYFPKSYKLVDLRNEDIVLRGLGTELM